MEGGGISGANREVGRIWARWIEYLLYPAAIPASSRYLSLEIALSLACCYEPTPYIRSRPRRLH